MSRRAACAVALALLAAPLPAMAQAYQCTVPQRVDSARPVKQDGPTRRVAVSGYVLAVSWSPEFCKGGRDRQSMQCSGANGRFGFVLHGLWPEARSGPSPQWCSLTPRPTPALVRRNLCMTPVPWLIEHEWAKHGSCMTRTPEAYYRTASALWRSLRWPDADALSRQEGLTAGDLRSQFVRANPDWRADQVGLVLSRTGWLRELRLCYDRKFMPAACERRSIGARDGTPIKIWRGL